MESDPLRPVGDLSAIVSPPAEERPHYDRATVLDAGGKTTVRVPVAPSSIIELLFIATDGTVFEPSSSSSAEERSIAVVDLEVAGAEERAGVVRAILS